MSGSRFTPGSIAWFAVHELRLSWRDFMAMMTAGKTGRERTVIGVLIAAAAVLHVLAWGVLSPALQMQTDAFERLILTGALMILPMSLMVSQAMESVTRVFYGRSDLDLVFSSPASQRRIFAVRVGAVAFATTSMSLLLGAPAINMLAILDHPGWLAAYPVTMALGMIATTLALCMTMALFKLLGARRTRMLAQIVAAIVGAVFIIGIQLAAISSMGTISRIRFLQSDMVRQWLPGPDSWLWIAPRALSGDGWAFMVTMGFALALFIAGIMVFSRSFAATVIAAAGVSELSGARKTSERAFRSLSIASALRHKEWRLLARDQWLISQTLMQVFYLVPPAFMLWQGFGDSGALATVVIPVFVMATGQLAGGLAWLAISGEDAPQLVATAPVRPGSVLRAKIEAVLGVIILLSFPILIGLAITAPQLILAALLGIAAASISATAIQLWFRSQAKRSNFRRRQTSSRIATFAEAFSSILWAGTAGLAANGSTYAAGTAALALAVVISARAFRPQMTGEFA